MMEHSNLSIQLQETSDFRINAEYSLEMIGEAQL